MFLWISFEPPKMAGAREFEKQVHGVDAIVSGIKIVGETRFLSGDRKHLFGDALVELGREYLEHRHVGAELAAGTQYIGESFETRAEIMDVEPQARVA